MRTFFAFALALFALGFVSCSDSNAPTASEPASKTVSMWQDFDGWVYNTCCGQVVNLSGKIHITMKDGALHYNGASIEGTDEDGNTYSGNLVVNVNEDFEDDGSGCVSQIVNYNFSGSGDCDFSAKIRFRACVDADGNVTVTQEVIEFNCI
jgi:hypothetical protein